MNNPKLIDLSTVDGSDVPVLLILFNRPDFTRILIDKLSHIKPKNIYIFIDGPRNNQEKIFVDETKNVVKDINWDCNVVTNYQNNNVGCKDGVVKAIDWFFESVSFGAILEDDCIPTRSFFKFAKIMSVLYSDDTQVMQISGNNFLPEYDSDRCYISSINDIWGWCTWRHKWASFSFEMSGIEEFGTLNNIIRYTKNIYIAEWLYKYINDARTPCCRIWSTYWLYAMIKQHGYTLVPPKNLVKNIGFLRDGESGSSESFRYYSGIESTEIEHCELPDLNQPDTELDKLRFKIVRKTDPCFKSLSLKLKLTKYIMRIIIGIGFVR